VSALPEDAAARNEYPLADGLLHYFPAALAAVARVSKIGNDQHNPGQPMHWARGKSTDHENKIIRHLLDAGTLDKDGTRHSAKVAWRALALLQEELEREEGAPLPRNAKVPDNVAQAACAQLAAQLAAQYEAAHGSLDAIRAAVLGPPDFPPRPDDELADTGEGYTPPDETALPPHALADADDATEATNFGSALGMEHAP
jgi:hypothetical protein